MIEENNKQINFLKLKKIRISNYILIVVVIFALILTLVVVKFSENVPGSEQEIGTALVALLSLSGAFIISLITLILGLFLIFKAKKIPIENRKDKVQILLSGFLGIIAFIGVVIFIGVDILLQYRDQATLESQRYQSETIEDTESTNLKKYKNEKYGYEIQYLDGWDSPIESGDTDALTGSSSGFLKRGTILGFVISVYENDKNLSLQEWWKQDFYEKFAVKYEYSYEGSVSISPEVEAVKYTIQRIGFEDNAYLISKNQKIYTIYFSEFPGVEEIQEMLSTFRFSERLTKGETSKNAISDWQTFTNDVYGFSFQYPSNWQVENNTLPKKDRTTVSRSNENFIVANHSIEEYPKLTLWVNPLGFGVLPPDITYELSLDSDKSITVVSRKIIPEYKGGGMSNDDGVVVIRPKPTQLGFNHYFFLFSFNEGGEDFESIFNQILSTFKFVDNFNLESAEDIKELDVDTIADYLKLLNRMLEMEVSGFEYSDLDNDGQDELILSIYGGGTGGSGRPYIVKLSKEDDKNTLTYLEKQKEFTNDEYEGYSGKMGFDIVNNQLIESFPIYMGSDANCCPSGGLRYVLFKWSPENNELIVDKVVSLEYEWYLKIKKGEITFDDAREEAIKLLGLLEE